MRPGAILRAGRSRPWTWAALVAALFMPVGQAAELAAQGVLVGRVTLHAPPAAPPAQLSPYARPRYRPPARPQAPAAGSVQDVVVYLRGARPAPAPRAEVVEIQQRNRTIIPHVTPVQAGSSVAFPNDDDVFHNLFSLSAPHRFNLGRYPPGESRSERFDRPGVVRLFCDIHSEMNGVVLVVETPYFTTPDPDGSFRISAVPPGEYTAIVWHEQAGADSTRVVVRNGAETTLDFVLGG